MCRSVNFWNCTVRLALSKRTDYEHAINRPPCNQLAYLTIRVPCIYRLDGLTRRTSQDFNKRNRWGLSKRPRVWGGEDCGGGRGGKIYERSYGETAWESWREESRCCSCNGNFTETTSRRSSNGTVSPFGSHTKESSTMSGIATSTRM